MTQPVSTDYLKQIVRDASARAMELVHGLDAEQLIGPKLDIVNPLQWEIGHVAWFHEFFILRRKYGREKIHERGDRVYDSIAIHHETRWDLPLLTIDKTQRYTGDVENELINRLEDGMASEQDMHDEAHPVTVAPFKMAKAQVCNAEFVEDDYKEYTEPLFGSTRVLRGGAWPTRGRMIDSTYRNFYGPDRRDVLAGFRTCAL